MTTTPKTHSKFEWQRTIISKCLICSCMGLVACSEPPEKPVPPFNPSKAVKEPAAKPLQTPGPATLTRMPLGDLYQLVEKNAAIIFDVRPTVFYKMGHIPGAVSFPQSNFERDIAKHDASIRTANANNTPVVIYCTDMACPDAMTVATKMVKSGYSVSVLQGGYEAWKLATN